jgi:hypothetical protein
MRELLAHSREAGTPDAARAREVVVVYLTGLGYQVTLQRFTFHPSSLLGFPLFGAGLGGLGVALVPLLAMARVPSWGATVVWLTGLGAFVILAFSVAAGWLSLGGTPREDANLIATRGDGAVRRWLVAHLDSKAQAQSMAGRLVSVWVIGLALTVLSGITLLRLRGPIAPWPVASAALLAVGAGALAGRGRLQGSSPGARDNGSGIAAVLAAAQRSGTGTGILISGAEEFGMVGARIFARLEADRLRETTVVNFDTLDQEGTLYLVSHDRIGASAAHELRQRLSGLGLPLQVRRLPLGILVDSLPLARAGARAITVGRLTWRTLRRIHTPRDTPHDLSLETAVQVGRAIASN